MRLVAAMLLLVVFVSCFSTARQPAERSRPGQADPSQPAADMDVPRLAPSEPAPETVEDTAVPPAKTAEPEPGNPEPEPSVQSPAPALEFVSGPSVVRPPLKSSPPVLADVLRRLPDPTYWRDQTEPTDLVTWTHEGSHGVCVRLPRVKGAHAIYLLDGQAVYLRHPRLTIGQVAGTIPPKERGRIYKLYMVDQRRDWDREPIYLVEEWTCYVHGTLARRQLGLERREETESHALEMERYCRAILALARRVDPTYSDAGKLSAFIEWNAERFRRFQKVEPVRVASAP